MSADQWSENVRLFEIEPLFTCTDRGRDLRPDFQNAKVSFA
jgi:hypothetical protein